MQSPGRITRTNTNDEQWKPAEVAAWTVGDDDDDGDATATVTSAGGFSMQRPLAKLSITMNELRQGRRMSDPLPQLAGSTDA